MLAPSTLPEEVSITVPRTRVDAGRVTRAVVPVVFLVLALSIASVSPEFGAIVIGATVGALGGYLVFRARASQGLGASLTAEREPDGAGTINIASIPVIGIGGLGLVAMAAWVAWTLPRVQDALLLGLAGGIAGAAAVLLWRRVRGESSPLESDTAAPLHLR